MFNCVTIRSTIIFYNYKILFNLSEFLNIVVYSVSHVFKDGHIFSNYITVVNLRSIRIISK